MVIGLSQLPVMAIIVAISVEDSTALKVGMLSRVSDADFGKVLGIKFITIDFSHL